MRGRSVYFEVDASPFAAGEASFIGQTLQRMGLRNVAPAALGPFPKLSPEFVVRAQPDIVIGDARARARHGAAPRLGGTARRCATAGSAPSPAPSSKCWCGPARAWARPRC